MATTLSSDHSAIYRNLQLRLAIANSHRIIKDRSEGVLMQVRLQYNSYDLMHNQES
jgi:hypothetical protein